MGDSTCKFPTSLSLLSLENSDLYHRRMTSRRGSPELNNSGDLGIDYEELTEWKSPEGPKLPERNPLVFRNVYNNPGASNARGKEETR